MPRSARSSYGVGMAGSFSPNAGRPSPGSWLANWLDRQRSHPDTFNCGVRTVDGAVPGESGRWKYRRSAVDRLRLDDVVTLHHGTKDTLRLRMDADPYWQGSGPRPRQGLIMLVATVVDSGARLVVAVPPGEVVRFGVDTF
jgi:hypothetical protein